MKSKAHSIEIKNSHSLEMAMREFRRVHCMARQSAKIGCSENVLRNKLDPDNEYNKLSVEQAVQLTANTGDLSILRAMADMLGHDLHQIGGKSLQADLAHMIFGSMSHTGRLASDFDRANKDNVITKEEARTLVLDAKSLIKGAQELISSLENID